MLQEVFTKIENIFSAVIQPEYKVTTDTPRQVSEIKNRKGVVIVTVHTQNHIEVANYFCTLLNSKK